MSHLQKRRRRWYAILNVPKDVQKQLGKKRFVQSLKTESKSEAQRIALSVVAQWRHYISTARSENPERAEMLVLRDMLRKAKSQEDRELALEFVQERLDWLRMHGTTSGDPTNASIYDDEAETRYKFITDQLTSISDHLDEWLAEQSTKDKTKGERRSALAELAREHPTVQEIDRRAASAFIRGKLSPSLSPASVNKKVSAYQTYWRWLSDRGYIDENLKNPWERQSLKTSNRRTEGRKPIPDDVGAMVIRDCETAAGRYPDDALVVKLLAVTGMRLEEVGSLERGDLKDDGEVIWITIREGKTENAARRIPVVEDVVVEALRKRLGDSSDGLWLFPRLTPNKYGDRTQALSKRLARRLRRHTDDPGVVAGHGWRHRARTAQEQAEVFPWVSDWFFGHKRPGEGLGRYSKGPSDEQLIDAATALDLPEVA